MGTPIRIPWILAIVGAMAVAAGCSDASSQGPTFEVSFDSSLARTTRDSAIRVELYLVESCGGVSLGNRPVPSIANASVLRGGGSGSFGSSLPDGDFGLYGVAQDADCAVVAAGCAPVTIEGGAGPLAVTLNSFAGEGCPTGLVCSIETGNCNDGTGGTGGTGGQPVMRVDAGLILLYEFDEGSGSVVLDQSDVQPAHHLTIADPANVRWSSGNLRIQSSTILSTGGGATKVAARAQASGELTVEAWVRPEDDAQSGPARIVSMSVDPQLRNFMLGQEGGTYAARFRADGERDWDNGSPTIFTTSGTAETRLTHVVHTHAADGSETLYVDGVQDTVFSRAGGVSRWDATYPIVVANEGTRDRPWLGELHLIAVFDRALEASEIQQNYAAGP